MLDSTLLSSSLNKINHTTYLKVYFHITFLELVHTINAKNLGPYKPYLLPLSYSTIALLLVTPCIYWRGSFSLDCKSKLPGPTVVRSCGDVIHLQCTFAFVAQILSGQKVVSRLG